MYTFSLNRPTVGTLPLRPSACTFQHQQFLTNLPYSEYSTLYDTRPYRGTPITSNNRSLHLAVPAGSHSHPAHPPSLPLCHWPLPSIQMVKGSVAFWMRMAVPFG